MDQKPSILVVEDHQNIIEILRLHLEREGYQITEAHDGAEAIIALEKSAFELVILDWMLPRMDGLEVCRRLRQKSQTPILMLTAREDEMDKVLGLEMGADDYMTKPFGIRELLARVRALLRRASRPSVQGESLEFGGLRLAPEKREALVAGQAIELTPKEFDLLLFLAKNQGRVYSRVQLLEHVWGYHFDGYERTIDSHVQKLRKKIEADPKNPVHLKTAWGVGYRFDA